MEKRKSLTPTREGTLKKENIVISWLCNITFIMFFVIFLGLLASFGMVIGLLLSIPFELANMEIISQVVMVGGILAPVGLGCSESLMLAQAASSICTEFGNYTAVSKKEPEPRPTKFLRSLT